MKTIKTVLIAALLVLGANASAQISFGVKAGVNLSNYSGDVKENKAKVGFNAGLTADYTLAPSMYLMSGLEITAKGCKFDFGTDGKSTTNAIYLQLPVHFGYKVSVSEGTNIVLHAGPYVAYGIAGKSGEGEDKVDTFGKNGLCKRFDFGAGLGVGVEFGKIGVGLGYDLGMLNVINGNLSNDNDSKAKVRNMNAYLSVGYKF